MVFLRKINNKQNSILQKGDKYNEFINKYLQKIDYQRKKLLILHEEAIEDYKAFKKSHTD